MGILEEAGHPVMKSEYTYDMMIKNVKDNAPYHMLDTPHNELHGITMLVTHCKFLALFASIIEMDKKCAAQEAPNASSSVAPTAIAIREDLPIAHSRFCNPRGCARPLGGTASYPGATSYWPSS